MKRVLPLLWICLIFFCGCSNRQTKHIYRAVTEVDVYTEYENTLIQRHYNTSEKMRPVLLYLRLLKPYGNPVNSSDVGNEIYYIRISLSDGKQHYYRQASHRYLSKENGPWKSIDPDQASKLYEILRKLPNDPPAN
jgi:hypothetical protein